MQTASAPMQALLQPPQCSRLFRSTQPRLSQHVSPAAQRLPQTSQLSFFAVIGTHLWVVVNVASSKFTHPYSPLGQTIECDPQLPATQISPSSHLLKQTPQ